MHAHANPREAEGSITGGMHHFGRDLLHACIRDRLWLGDRWTVLAGDVSARAPEVVVCRFDVASSFRADIGSDDLSPGPNGARVAN